jgi:hypothetical protein
MHTVIAKCRFEQCPTVISIIGVRNELSSQFDDALIVADRANLLEVLSWGLATKSSELSRARVEDALTHQVGIGIDFLDAREVGGLT